MSSDIDYLQSLFLRILDGVSCPSARSIHIADTDTAVVYQMTVALIHTARCVLLGCINYFIRTALDALILFYIPPVPALRLGQAGKDKDQFDTRAFLLHGQHRLGGKRIEANSTPSAIISDASLIQVSNDSSQFIGDLHPFSE
jgi:hypothetical protein